jgi:hypothetical protein
LLAARPAYKTGEIVPLFYPKKNPQNARQLILRIMARQPYFRDYRLSLNRRRSRDFSRRKIDGV